jgi:hypothetical protein
MRASGDRCDNIASARDSIARMGSVRDEIAHHTAQNVCVCVCVCVTDASTRFFVEL